MSASLEVMRIPDGDSEYQFTEDRPTVGDLLTRNGENWVVEQVAHAKNGSSLVALRPADVHPTSIRV